MSSAASKAVGYTSAGMQLKPITPWYANAVADPSSAEIL